MMVGSQGNQTRRSDRMPRTRRAAAPAPAPEPVVEETAEDGAPAKRGPGPLALAHVKWIKQEYGVVVDPEHLYLAQTTRREFRASEIYETYLEEEDARREAADAEKAKRAEERLAKAEAATPEPEAEAPATRTRRPRKATAAAVSEPATDVVTETAPATRRRRGAAAPAAAPVEASTETAPKATTRTRGKAPF
jgi:hypothetical protein